MQQVDWFPLWLSLRVASLATLISLTLGLALAYALANWRFRGKEALDALTTLPMVLPPTVLGYYLLVMLGRDSFLGKLHEQVWGAPLVFTWQAAVVASTVHAVPLLVKVDGRAVIREQLRLTGRFDVDGALPAEVVGRAEPPLETMAAGAKQVENNHLADSTMRPWVSTAKTATR